MKSKAVFLDKDGTLIEDIPFNVVPERIHFSTDTLDALIVFQNLGYQLIVVTNQSGVARGYFSEAALNTLAEYLQEFLTSKGIQLDGLYYCPHHPQGTISEYAIDCSCRKPQPGLIVRGAVEHEIDLSASWMIGDILNDVEAGNQAGCQTILLNNGHETEWHVTPIRRPDFVVNNLKEAAQLVNDELLAEQILNDDQQK